MTRPCPACGAAEERFVGEKNSHRLVRCARCATLRTSDFAQKAYGDLYAGENEPPPSLAKRLDDIVAGFAPFRRSGRLLDVGFGWGDGHVQLFSVSGLRALLRGAGFGDIGIAAEGPNPHEILRRGRMRPGERIDAAYELNAFFEERRGRRAVKRGINRVLSALRLGDSLKFTARRYP